MEFVGINVGLLNVDSSSSKFCNLASNLTRSVINANYGGSKVDICFSAIRIAQKHFLLFCNFQIFTFLLFSYLGSRFCDCNNAVFHFSAFLPPEKQMLLVLCWWTKSGHLLFLQSEKQKSGSNLLQQMFILLFWFVGNRKADFT